MNQRQALGASNHSKLCLKVLVGVAQHIGCQCHVTQTLDGGAVVVEGFGVIAAVGLGPEITIQRTAHGHVARTEEQGPFAVGDVLSTDVQTFARRDGAGFSHTARCFFTVYQGVGGHRQAVTEHSASAGVDERVGLNSGVHTIHQPSVGDAARGVLKGAQAGGGLAAQLATGMVVDVIGTYGEILPSLPLASVAEGAVPSVIAMQLHTEVTPSAYVLT